MVRVPKGIDINKAMEMLLSQYPRQGASILGLIDASFEKFLPESVPDLIVLMNLFNYEQWRAKLPDRVRSTTSADTLMTGLPKKEDLKPTGTAPIELKSELVVPPLEHKSTGSPEGSSTSKSTFSPSVTPSTTLRIAGGISPAITSAPTPPIPLTQAPSTSRPPPVKLSASVPESKARPLAEILANFMRPVSPDAKPPPLPPLEEREQPDSAEPILSTGVSESTLSVIEKLRQRRASLAEILEKHSGEGEKVTSSQTSITRPISTPPTPATLTPAATFASPREWFEAKAKKTFYFTKFMFRLTPEEKKYKEYVVGVGEFAPKNFVLRSAVLEMKVRLMKGDDEAIAIFWDWLKRGIIEEEKQVGESDQL